MIQADYTPSPRFRPQLTDDYDVLVMGGGPAGATVAALIAEQGHRVALLERHTVPRFHVGESLIPETYWSLERLGVLEQIRETGFPKKFSVQFFSDGSKPSNPFYFDMHNSHESSQTWQVERADFDQILLENAVSKGAVIHSDAQILDLLFDGDRAVGVRVKLHKSDEEGDAEIREIGARVVVDCTGQSAFIASRLGLKTSDPRLRKGTVWTYFRGARRDPGKDEGATLIMQTEGKQSWFWYIPLRNDVVSVGCTGAMHSMFPKGATAEAAFQRELDRCPAMQERLASATRCLDYYTTRDYSYKSKQAAGDGWVLCGDAYGFIDPVYSSGVYLALKCGEFVADAVNDALQADDLSAARLGAWKTEYDQGVENFRRLVYAFYTPGFSFGEFLRAHPDQHGHIVDILIGAVFKPDVAELFEKMGDVLPPSELEPASA
ncbi:MAG: tryptophan 7-halogenase [Planctomycetaceae bacterium]|nr:tryptophan 7-halogenase [Planctomycetaceae bacterium]